MNDTSKIVSSDEAWDERELGGDPNFVRVSSGVDEAQLDEAAGLVPVSIRLQKALIEDFRFIAELTGDIGYQTLMRQVLNRFAECEKKRILKEVAEARREQREREEETAQAEMELRRAAC